MSVFRVLAIILSVGAGLWGIFCSYFLIYGDRELSLLIFGPGYVVLAGYLWIAIGYPHSDVRRLVWGLSALVQGAWLVFGVLVLLHDRLNGFAILIASWWFGSFVVSICGAAMDKSNGVIDFENWQSEMPEEKPPDNDNCGDHRHGIKPADDFAVKRTNDLF